MGYYSMGAKYTVQYLSFKGLLFRVKNMRKALNLGRTHGNFELKLTRVRIYKRGKYRWCIYLHIPKPENKG